MKKIDQDAVRVLRLYANLGLELFVAVMIGSFGGYWLDKWLKAEPYLMLLGFFFGVIAGFRNILAMVKKDLDGK